jgi:hypothetical protein
MKRFFLTTLLLFLVHLVQSQTTDTDLKLKSFDVVEHYEISLNQGIEDTTYYFKLNVICGYKYPNIKENFDCVNYYFQSKNDLTEFYSGLKSILEKGSDGTHYFISKENKQYIFQVKNGKLYFDFTDKIANGIKSIPLSKISDDLKKIEAFEPKKPH